MKAPCVCETKLEAVDENLAEVQSFLDARLEAAACTPKVRMQLIVAAEEIFVNIAHYAYAPETGDVILRVELSDEPPAVTLTFIDQGFPYDPLSRADPDVTLSADERKIGGLGVFLAKRFMDDMDYACRDGCNILTMKKYL